MLKWAVFTLRTLKRLGNQGHAQGLRVTHKPTWRERGESPDNWTSRWSEKGFFHWGSTAGDLQITCCKLGVVALFFPLFWHASQPLNLFPATLIFSEHLLGGPVPEGLPQNRCRQKLQAHSEWGAGGSVGDGINQAVQNWWYWWLVPVWNRESPSWLSKNIKKHTLHFEDSVELTMLIQPARNQLSQLVQLIPATKMCWCTNSDHLDDGKSEHREEIGCRFNGLFGLSADGLAHLWVVGVGEIGETLIWWFWPVATMICYWPVVDLPVGDPIVDIRDLP